MPADDDNAKIRWEDGDLPVSTDFDDPYFSRQDGLAEATHVFLDGNDLPDRFAGAKAFTIAELGFGTGLNFLAATSLWNRTAAPGARLSFVSFEMFPMRAADMARALAPWPEVSDLATALCTAWPAEHIALPGADLVVHRGDARTAVPAWTGAADAWFLDGFAPARNPEMWGQILLTAVHGHTRPGGSFATYAAAGHVRRSLAAAGFNITRAPGHGRKREMLKGRRD